MKPIIHILASLFLAIAFLDSLVGCTRSGKETVPPKPKTTLTPGTSSDGDAPSASRTLTPDGTPGGGAPSSSSDGFEPNGLPGNDLTPTPFSGGGIGSGAFNSNMGGQGGCGAYSNPDTCDASSNCQWSNSTCIPYGSGSGSMGSGYGGSGYGGSGYGGSGYGGSGYGGSGYGGSGYGGYGGSGYGGYGGGYSGSGYGGYGGSGYGGYGGSGYGGYGGGYSGSGYGGYGGSGYGGSGYGGGFGGSGYGGTTNCMSIFQQSPCDAQSNCQWSYDSNSCVPYASGGMGYNPGGMGGYGGYNSGLGGYGGIGGTGTTMNCGLIRQASICDAQSNCQWLNSCVPYGNQGGSQSGYYGSSSLCSNLPASTCNVTPNCLWSVSVNMCMPSPYSSGLGQGAQNGCSTMYPQQRECDRSTNCQWSTTLFRCVPFP